jgi:hypothetical protein
VVGLRMIEGGAVERADSQRLPPDAVLRNFNGRGGQLGTTRRGGPLCAERTEDGTLCSLLATTCDVDKGYPVCALHAIGPAEREWLAGLLTGWADQFLGRRRARG